MKILQILLQAIPVNSIDINDTTSLTVKSLGFLIFIAVSVWGYLKWYVDDNNKKQDEFVKKEIESKFDKLRIETLENEKQQSIIDNQQTKEIEQAVNEIEYLKKTTQSIYLNVQKVDEMYIGFDKRIILLEQEAQERSRNMQKFEKALEDNSKNLGLLEKQVTKVASNVETLLKIFQQSTKNVNFKTIEQ